MSGKIGNSIGWRRQRRLAAYVALSLPLFWAIQYASYWLRFEGAIDDEMLQQIRLTAPWVALIKAVMFAWLRVYQGWNRYVTFYDLIVLGSGLRRQFARDGARAPTSLPPTFVIPRSVFLLDCLGTIGVFGALRSMWRCAA